MIIPGRWAAYGVREWFHVGARRYPRAVALYRKYRPATFAEVVGQEHVTDPLSTALDTGRISHAYLFSGPRGCGKTSSARILARSLNCVEGPTSRPCGVCSSCVALAPGGAGNLDVIELDAASHGGVDDTRELRDRAFYAPAESRYRVFIVDEAHMVTTAGFNALLKIVEEPPAHLIFIFATTEPEKVLPTIRSRTHHYPFRLLPPATMRGLLGKICDQEQVQVEESVYPLVIRAGGGSPRDSLSVLDQLLAGAGPEGVTYPRALALLGVTDIALIDEAIEALATDDGAALFATVDRVVEAGHDPRRFATDLLERIRDLILLRAVPDAAERNLVTGPGDVIDRMSAQADSIGPATLARYAELLHEGLGDMRGATAPRLLLEVICARMLLPSVSEAESAALQRLERLERRVASGVPTAVASEPGAATAPAAAGAMPPSSQARSQAPAGEPRRRGAEALAAMREKKTAAPHPAQRAQSPTGPQEQRPQELSSPDQTVPAAPVNREADVRPGSTPGSATVDSGPAAESAPAPQPVESTGSSTSAVVTQQNSHSEADPATDPVAGSPGVADAEGSPGAAHRSSSTGPSDSGPAPHTGAADRPDAVPDAAVASERSADTAGSGGAVREAPMSEGTAGGAGDTATSTPSGGTDPENADAEAKQRVADRGTGEFGVHRSGVNDSADPQEHLHAESAGPPETVGSDGAVSDSGASDSADAQERRRTESGTVPDASDRDASVRAHMADAAGRAGSGRDLPASDVVGGAGGAERDTAGPEYSADVADRIGTDGGADAAGMSHIARDADATGEHDRSVSVVGRAQEATASDTAGVEASGIADAGLPSQSAAPSEGTGREVPAEATGTAADVGHGVTTDAPDMSTATGDADATGPAAAAGADVLREIDAAWADIRSKARESSAALHALLSGAGAVRIEEDTIVFAHPHAPLAQRLSGPKNIESIRAAVQAVIGRQFGVRWEVGSPGAIDGGGVRPTGGGAAAERPEARGGTEQSAAHGVRGDSSGQAQPPRFVRPSQSQPQSADTEKPGGRTDTRGGAADRRDNPGQGQRREFRPPRGAGAADRTAPDDDIPPPDAPDYPDDPGPSDYSPVGYDGVPPALTPEEEQEMLAESARPVPPEQRRDPDEVALELLRSELGATRMGS